MGYERLEVVNFTLPRYAVVMIADTVVLEDIFLTGKLGIMSSNNLAFEIVYLNISERACESDREFDHHLHSKSIKSTFNEL